MIQAFCQFFANVGATWADGPNPSGNRSVLASGAATRPWFTARRAPYTFIAPPAIAMAKKTQ